MGRINRRIYAKRRKRSSAFKMFAPGGITPDGTRPDGSNVFAQQRAPDPNSRTGSLRGTFGSRGGANYLEKMQYQQDKEAQEMSDFYANKDGDVFGGDENGGSQDLSANGLNIKITKI